MRIHFLTAAVYIFVISCVWIQESFAQQVSGETTANVGVGLPPSGLEPKKVVIHVDYNKTGIPFDPLQGATFRGNLYRNGVYQSQGLLSSPKTKWVFKTGGAVKSSPVALNGIVYVGSCDKNLYAIDAVSGDVKWKFSTGGEIKGSATVWNGKVYFLSLDGKLYAVDASSGKEIWSVAGNASPRNVCTPSVAYGVVFAYLLREDYTHGLYAYDAKTGKNICRYFNAYVYPLQTHEAFTYSPAMLDGIIAFAGSILDIRTGETTHESYEIAPGWALETPNVGALDKESQSAFYSTDNSCFRFQINGKRIWQHWIVPIKNNTERWAFLYPNAVKSSPALWNGKMIFGCYNKNVYAFDMKNGQPLWACQTGGIVWSSPAVSSIDGSLYIGCQDGNLYAIDSADGKLLWKHPLDGILDSSPCLYNGVVYVGSDNGGIYAVESGK